MAAALVLFCLQESCYVTILNIRALRLIGVRARGAVAPPNFGQLRFFGQQEKIWAEPVFKDISMFTLLLF